MAKPISDIITDYEVLLALEPEELAGLILEYLNSLSGRDTNLLHMGNFLSSHNVTNYQRERHEIIRQAFTEAWVWLEREGLIAPRTESGPGWVFITRRGRRLKNSNDFEAYRKANLLSRQLLHPLISDKVYTDFMRGDYDSAVFKAFKQVEVAVRNAGGYDLTDYGVHLMWKAFNKSSGALTDYSIPESEREALAHLFAGSIGLFKNPHSHRNVPLSDPIEAIEILMIASHLLKIVDFRKTQTSAP